MKDVLANLEPKLVWALFEQISRIPRCSKKEQKIRAWIKGWAKEQQLSCKEDAAGNLLLCRSGASGCENLPTLILQAHLDMVCVRDERAGMDFENDPIRLRVEGSTVRAEGTTLGADNGIGVAYCLAALVDSELECGPLEVLLTVDEEQGGTGALGLKTGFFSGSYLLNLDSEETGIITIGTAGFEITDYTLSLSSRDTGDSVAIRLSIQGLAGGHSGMDIHLPRLNAIKMAVEALNTLIPVVKVRLCRLHGGEATNSIPAKAECLLVVPVQDGEDTLTRMESWRQAALSRARESEPGLEISIERISLEADAKACRPEETDAICRFLSEIPHGPLAYSRDIEGLVESSANLARVQSKKRGLEINVSCRSSVVSSQDELSKMLKELGKKYRAKIRQHGRVPGWAAEPGSSFSKLVQNHYRAALGREVELKAFHAGLECGIFTGIAPGLQMASIGPDIRAVHTPEEEVDIPSVAVLWDVLGRIIKGMGELEGENHE